MKTVLLFLFLIILSGCYTTTSSYYNPYPTTPKSKNLSNSNYNSAYNQQLQSLLDSLGIPSNSSVGTYGQTNQTKCAGSAFGSLNPCNAFGEYSSPFGSLNPSNSFGQGISPTQYFNFNNQ